jgi:Ethylbenzene dehydrogenase/Planctomycete cytochrome C
MRTRHLFWLILLTAPMLLMCSVEGSGKPVPPLPSDFAQGATIPGWVQQLPQAGRGEVLASSVHADGRWTVLLSRPLRTRPRDMRFSFAVMDDGIAHVGKPLLRFTADPSVVPFSEVVVCRSVPNGMIVPDGVMNAAEWPATALSFIPLTDQDSLPTGAYPPTAPTVMFAASAYDDEYVYFVFQWTDPSASQSDLGPQLQWNGTSWTRRPHRANDFNENGLIDPFEAPLFTAAAEDEDRLALFFPVHDATGAFQTGAAGCATSCHQNLGLDPIGSEAVHAWLLADDRTDAWVWRASSTAPARLADDLRLGFADPALGKSGGGSGFAADAGNPPFVTQDLLNPASMFAAPPAGHAFLVEGPLQFGATTEPNFPVIPTVPTTAAPYDGLNFNGSGSPPATWTGVPPFFGNDFLPPFVQRMATDGRADVETGSTFAANKWTVEFRRRRTTRDLTGAPRSDDVQFDEDAPFKKEAFDVTSAALGLPFSVATTDRASGHGTRETLYPGPLRMSQDETLAGPVLSTDLLLHDYGAGFLPASAADFTDPRETRPAPSAGTDVNLVLKAGTNGGQTLFVLAQWDDPVPDWNRDGWSWDGFFWTRGGLEDELRFLWNATVPRDAFVSGGGCAYLCHGPAGPLGAPSAAHFSTAAINEAADVWRWMAGRGGPISVADDETADWRFFDGVDGSSANAAIHGDAGRSAFTVNFDPARTFPVFMADTDPNANAPFISLAGAPAAVPFVDVLGNLPPPPPGGGGSGVSFATQVLPIFMMHCAGCHPPFASLNLQSYSGVLAGGSSGPAVIPGNPAGSLLIRRVLGQIPPQMPLGSAPLSPQNIQLISDWIAAGAPNN